MHTDMTHDSRQILSILICLSTFRIACVTQSVAAPRSGDVEVTIHGQTANWTGPFQYEVRRSLYVLCK